MLYILSEQDPKAKKIRTESGAWIPATYKTNRYNMWKEKSKVDENESESDNEEESSQIQNCKLIYNLLSKKKILNLIATFVLQVSLLYRAYRFILIILH